MNLTEEQRLIARAILSCESESFVVLAEVAELDPASDFREADLRGVSFGQVNLRGYDFSGADLRGADLSEAEIEGAIFDSATIEDMATLWPSISPIHLAPQRLHATHINVISSTFSSAPVGAQDQPS